MNVTLKNNTDYMAQEIILKTYSDFLLPIDLPQNTHVVLIKIRHLDQLSIFFETVVIDQIIYSAIDKIKETLSNKGYIYHQNIRYSKGYIQLFLYNIDQQDIPILSYIIYKTIQLFNNNEYGVPLECTLTSTLYDSDPQMISKLLYTLTTSSTTHYYVEPNVDIIELNNIYNNHRIIQQAIMNDTFFFAYQPIIERSTGVIAYYECLLRIKTHENKIISAGPYIPIAENTGLSCIIDHKVLSMALKELEAAKNISLSINISSIGLLDTNLLNILKQSLSDRSIAERLTIEITETSLNTNIEKIKLFTDTVRKLGCKIAIDDFGSGFTSFKQLQNIDIDIMKIDGSFIKDIAYNKRNQNLVLSLIDIAKQIGAKTVAEFVENGEIAKILLNAKIDYMQGNFFSPALNYRSWDKN